jgi:glycosyltransferase involved in cell wall biosynthesis
VTVHDLSFEHRSADFSAYERAWHRLARPRRLAHRADRLIAVSETVRRDVLEEWRIDPRKIVAVPSGPGRDRPAGGPATRAGRAAGYLLAVGALEPRKRPGLLVEAHTRARSAGLQAELVLAGEGPLREELSARGATLLGHVSDEQLEALYEGALAVVCVSREEGFAFTPLEAAARGVPAVVSDLPVFTETLDDGALRVPAGDPDALARALLRIEREDDLRRRLVASGRRAIARLSWDQAAERTRTVLAEAAASRR